MTWAELLTPARKLFDDHPSELDERLSGKPFPLVSTCGGGLNSTAGLVLLWKLGIVPDAITFGDTGGEKPETYEHIIIVSAWCQSIGFPEIFTLRRDVDYTRQKRDEKYNTLEEECLVKRCLPSIAYYHRTCSQKWKHAPQEKWVNQFEPAQTAWGEGRKVIRALYFEAGEEYRAKPSPDPKYVNWFPLLDYDWDRDDCEAAIRLAGLPVPPKSSCFFCPEMTPDEILALPLDLQARALAMEDNADLRTIKGLGKHEYSWREVIEGRIPLETVKACRTSKTPCMCYDG